MAEWSGCDALTPLAGGFRPRPLVGVVPVTLIADWRIPIPQFKFVVFE